MERQDEITALLQEVRSGEERAMQRLQPLVYDVLRSSSASVVNVRLKNPSAPAGVDDVTQQLRIPP